MEDQSIKIQQPIESINTATVTSADSLSKYNGVFKLDLPTLYLQILESDPELCDSSELIEQILCMGEFLRSSLFSALVQRPPDFPQAFAELRKAEELQSLFEEESNSLAIFESFIYNAYARVYMQYITLNQDLQGQVPEIPKEWLDQEDDSNDEETKEQDDKQNIGVIEDGIGYAIQAKQTFDAFCTNNKQSIVLLARSRIENLRTLSEILILKNFYEEAIDNLKEAIDICLSLPTQDNLELSGLYLLLSCQEHEFDKHEAAKTSILKAYDHLKLELLQKLQSINQPINIEEATKERLMRPSIFDTAEIKSLKEMLGEISEKLDEIVSYTAKDFQELKETQKEMTTTFTTSAANQQKKQEFEVFNNNIDKTQFLDITKTCSFKIGLKRTYQESRNSDTRKTEEEEEMGVSKRKKGESGDFMEVKLPK